MTETARRRAITDAIIDCGVVAVIRTDDPEQVMRAVEAIRKGGITAIEITMTTPGALDLIETVSHRMADDDEVLIGVGSVLDAETVSRAVAAGARYAVSPVFKAEVVEAAHQRGIPALPGALTPTEIQRAHEAGADIVKVFPASTVGASYCRAVLAPLPHLKLMPTGGVTAANAGDWLQAGASAVAAGSALLEKEALASGSFERITENAQALRRSIEEARDA